MAISQEEFKKLLKEKGLKVTNQRLLVLEVLADHRDTHMTAEDIYDMTFWTIWSVRSRKKRDSMC